MLSDLNIMLYFLKIFIAFQIAYLLIQLRDELPVL